ATDPDRGDSHSYSVSDDRFEVVGGKLKLKDGVSVDYAAERSISLNITATDGGNLSVSKTLMLNVQDDPAYPAAAAAKEAGLNLDMARKFYSPDAIKAFIDQIAASGGTFLHMHFADDENYALESSVLGQTTANATLNSEGMYINNNTGKPFISAAQLSDIASYAKGKGVELIPEMEMPAHIQAVFNLLNISRGSAYVESIRVDYDDAQGNPVAQLDTAKPAALNFAKEMIDEISGMFGNASRHFHIGGDEFTGAISQNNGYIAFVNALAGHLAGKGLKTRIWNDGVLKTSLGADGLDNSIEITYWSRDGEGTDYAAENREHRAGMDELLDAGYTVLNYSGNYLYYNPEGHKEASSADMGDVLMRNLLKDWQLGLWENDDVSGVNSVGDSDRLLGAALSIWGSDAQALDDMSIVKFAAGSLDAAIRLTNAQGDNSGEALAKLRALSDNDYAKLSNDTYLDLERALALNKTELDVGALGKQSIHLLNQDVLDKYDNAEIFIRGDSSDEIHLDSQWQSSGETRVLANPNYAGDQVSYQAYSNGNDKLWIDSDISVIMI
ncbi:MAG: family 20 glycosylhydrolase, partial [Neisseria sp.]|nr:family 20 glycosylhydrolase [Neisseria sp.]